MKNMKRNLTFVSLLAVLVMAISFTSALGSIDAVEFNGVDLFDSSVNNVAVSPGSVVPVWVQFTADDNASDVVIEVEIKGRNGVSVYKELSDIEDGSTYPSLLRLELPDTDDDLSEEFTLYVTVSSNTDEEEEMFEMSLKVQRKSYALEVLSVDYDSRVDAGDALPISVVLKNIGYNRADDVYVVASVPSLSLTTRGYAGDLIPTEDYINYDDEEDSVEEVVGLKIPDNAETGVYELVIKAYNEDSVVEVSKLLSIKGVEPKDSDSDVLNADGNSVSNSVIVLTVILVIIFVVLLAVLIVLLTKKEKTIEEVETSYY